MADPRLISVSNVAPFRMSALNAAVSDHDLIERTLAGDEAAFATLVERFQRQIYRVAFAIVRNDADADAITQDTFIQAYSHLARFEQRAEFETWLTRIAINRSRDTLRRRRFVSLFTRSEDGREIMLVEPLDERPDAERQLMSRQLRTAIERAVARLSPQQQVIFRLRHYENLALEDIADHLGLSAGTVRAHLFRAIHKVRKELSGWRTNEALQ